MEVIFFTGFSKRKNSTKRPNDADGIVRTVTLKGQCDLMNPMFFLKDVRPYTYCKAWGNYYYIHRIGHDIDGAEYVYCNIDVLASWKNQILNTSAYVVYSSSDYSTLLKDDRVPILADMSSTTNEDESVYFTPTDNPFIIFTCIGEDVGLQHWVIDRKDFMKLMACLLPDSLSEIWDDLALQFGDAMGSIVSAISLGINGDELPVHFPDEEDPPKYLKLGNYQPIIEGDEPGTTLYFGYVTRTHISERKTLDIPWHYTDYRKLEPFQKLLLTLPFVGEVQLAISDFLTSDKVYIRMDADIVTGSIAYTIENEENRVVSVYNAKMGRNIAIASNQIQNALGTLAGFGAAATIGLGMEVGAVPISSKGISATVAAAGKGFLNAHQHTNSIVGGYEGNWGEFAISKYKVTVQWYPTIIEPSELLEKYGRPCSRIRKIEGLTGYVETSGFSIEVDALDSVRDMINSAMDAGVYLE